MHAAAGEDVVEVTVVTQREAYEVEAEQMVPVASSTRIPRAAQP